MVECHLKPKAASSEIVSSLLQSTRFQWFDWGIFVWQIQCHCLAYNLLILAVSCSPGIFILLNQSPFISASHRMSLRLQDSCLLVRTGALGEEMSCVFVRIPVWSSTGRGGVEL